MTQTGSDGHHGDGFQSLKAQSREFLDEIKGRSLCPKCQKSRKFYCYTCYVLMDKVKEKLKHVKLPIKVDIIKHPNEVDGKSTAPHARVISPEDVTIYTYPCIPEYDKEKVILVFPCKESVTLDELKQTTATKNTELSIQRGCSSLPVENTDTVHQVLGKTSSSARNSAGEHRDRPAGNVDCCSADVCENELKRKVTLTKGDGDLCNSTDIQPKMARTDSSPENQTIEFANSSVPVWKFSPCFERVVFIDSTWLQSKKIFSDERLKGLRPVELKSRHTKYWRPQGDHPDTYLATIEAIYYFFVDFHEIFISDVYDGDYDNLLFFFLYAYDKVQSSKDSKKTRKR